MHRSPSALATLLLTIAAALPVAAQQSSPALDPPASEFCSGCFAFLEFPPPAEGDTPSNLATTRRPTPPPVTAEQQSSIAGPPLSAIAAVKGGAYEDARDR